MAARLNLAHGGIVPHLAGHYLDLHEAFEKVRYAALAGGEVIELPRQEVLPKVSREYLEKIDIHAELSRFRTGFSRSGEQESRAHNVDTAAAKLDGVVLEPHQLFSFNDVVGPRTVENGFSKGWEIFKGEMVQGIGGGTCQAASTLHAVAFLAGLDILERLPHSRPSAYITMGLDATVVYPVVDLKLRNPYDFPVVVHSWIEGNTVIMALLGRERPAEVTFGREVLATRPFTRKVEEMPGLAENRVIRKQHGIRGYRILRTRTIAYRDGTFHRESNVDVYPPTIEMFLVAPGTDAEAVLPPPGLRPRRLERLLGSIDHPRRDRAQLGSPGRHGHFGRRERCSRAPSNRRGAGRSRAHTCPAACAHPRGHRFAFGALTR